MSFPMDFPGAYGDALGSAFFRTELEDFNVTETLGFEPEGNGEHVYLDITKRGINTQWLAKQIARFASVKENDVGYCGMKDRHAVARQWFSIYLPKTEGLDWAAFARQDDLNVEIHSVSRGTRKLRRGQHLDNRFVIVLREITLADPEHICSRLEEITLSGVPNYFGEQRFGHDGNNLTAASRWLDQGHRIKDCGPKHIIISAARSYLFNLVLAHRVRSQSWGQVIEGDVLDSEGLFATGPLWGRGRSGASGLAGEIEQSVLADLSAWRDGLEHCGLSQERRALVSKPKDLKWHLSGRDLTLEFGLPPGQFATSLLKELVVLDNVSLRAG